MGTYFATKEISLGVEPKKNKRGHEGIGERFSWDVKDRVFQLQKGVSPITGNPITQYHHKTPIRVFEGSETSPNTVNNCLGVDAVAHAFIHYCEWACWGSQCDKDSYLGQLGNFIDEKQRQDFDKLIKDQRLVEEWGNRYRGMQKTKRGRVIFID